MSRQDQCTSDWIDDDVPKFQCPDGTCLRSDWKCDGEKDCPNGEDEDEEQGCPRKI